MRLFVGVPLPPSPAFGEVTGRLVALVPGTRPVPPGTWHVTLRFLGETRDPERVAAALASALAGSKGLPFHVRGAGAFPSPRKARVVWAGVNAPGLGDLAALARKATPLADDPDARRPFHAHATLARLDAPRDLREFVAAHRETEFASGRMTEAVLVRSDLTPLGPVYTRLAGFPLG